MSIGGIKQSNQNWAYSYFGKNPSKGMSGQTQNQKKASSTSQQLAEKLRGLNHDTTKTQQRDPNKKVVFQASSESVISQSQKYTQSLQFDRSQFQKTAQTVKKLKYRFKDVSSKILRSKTSLSAKQVVGQAKREVTRLKRAMVSGGYDQEEISAALSHAKAVERIAKKKAKHLEQEELATAASKSKENEERIEDTATRREQNMAQLAVAQETLASETNATDVVEEVYEMSPEEMEIMMASQENMLSLEENMADLEEGMMDLGELSMDMMEDLSDAYNEMMEELGFEELTESLMAASGEMSPEDIKMMKVEHRSKEVRDLMKADMEYLKAVFDHLEKEQQSEAAVNVSAPMTGFSSGGSASAAQDAMANMVATINMTV